MILVHLRNEGHSWEALSTLLHLSFEERVQQGLNFTCSTITADELRKQSTNSSVIVAVDDETKELVGTVSLLVNKEKATIYGYHYNLAVSPGYKHRGIATMMLDKLVQIATEENCSYISSDTAENATSSVRWHIKNGFYPISLRSFGSTNYYSIVFRKQLKNHCFWSNRRFCKLHYSISSLLYKNIRDKNGNLKGIGKIISFLRKHD